MTQNVDCVDIIYVTNKIKDMEATKDVKQLRKLITEFKEELVYNIGINTLNKSEVLLHNEL